MKSYNLLIWISILALFGACGKEFNAPQPNSGPVPNLSSSSKIYLNNELTSYFPNIGQAPGTERMNFFFRQNRGKYQNTIATILPTLTDTGFIDQKIWSFTQLHGHDQNNHVYDQIYPDKSMIHVTQVDTVTRVIKAEFEVWFKRREGGLENEDSYLPDTLHFVGIIDTTYFKY